MSYRDELEALRARNDALTRELAEARERIQELESAASRGLAPLVAPKPVVVAKQPFRLGAVRFHRPRTFFPLVHLWWTSVRAALAYPPRLGPFASDSVLLWIAHYLLLVPLTYGARVPLYWASLAVVLPVALAVCLALSAPMLVIVVVSALRVSTEPPAEEGWFHGHSTLEQGALFLWMIECVCLFPFLLTTTSLLSAAGGTEATSDD